MYLNKVEKFLIEVTLIDHTNDNVIDISEHINAIHVKKDYVNNSFPLFVFDIMTTEQIRNIMRDNEISVNLKVDKYSDINTELEIDDDEFPVIQDRIINTTIRVYDKPYASSNIYREEDSKDSPVEVIKAVPYQLTGIPSELIVKNDKVLNDVYEDVQVIDVIVNLVSQIEKNEIFLDSSDNKERYKSLMIPPLNIIPAIHYIQNMYGLYASPLGIFFDLNKTYIYKMLNEKRDKSTRLVEIITTPLTDINEDSKFTTPLIDSDENIRLHYKNTPGFVSNSDIRNDDIGRTTVFNSYDYDFDVIQRIYNNEEVDSNKTRYYWNPNQDKLFEDKFINEISQVNEISEITISNIDPSYFNINSRYIFDTQTSYANGEYNLLENSFSFFTDDYTHYSSIVYLKLAKIR